jgi:hypothetical protein
MAKAKKSKTKLRSTDWQVGQPLVFPTSKTANDIERLARDAVQEGMRGPFKRGQKRKKR